MPIRLRTIRRRDPPAVVGQRLVGVVDRRPEALDELQAAAHELAGRLHELLVEHVEGGLCRRVTNARTQQRGALLQDPFEITTRRFVTNREHAQQLVEIRAPRAGPFLHELEIVGREHRHPQQAVKISGLRDRALVAQDAIAPGCPDLGFEQLHADRRS